DKLRQINGVQDLLAKGVKGVLISPIDAVGVNAAYDAAAQAKIPIISIARGSASPNQTLHVAMDEKQIGRDIASWTAQRIGGKGMNGVPPALKAGKDGNVGMTVELNPVLWGRLGVDVLAAYLKGERTEQRVFIKHVIIDPANVDDAISRVTRS